MKCAKCGERESTGIMIRMCDPCFDDLERDHKKRVEENGGNPVTISDVEFTEMFGVAPYPNKGGN